jgi:outer membrane lipoprotein-sorting protein
MSGRRTLGLVAAGVLAAAGLTGLMARGAAADPVLPPLTPAELLTRMADADVDGLSATFEQRSDLGLPALPTGSLPNGDEVQTALSMLTGTHTVRVWLAGPEHAKVALVDGSTESSVVRNGNDVWAWSSEKQQARHATLKPGEKPGPSAAPTSPSEAIAKLLAAVAPTTDVTTSGTGYVAGRPVYQLVLTPKDGDSLVGQVRVSVDSQTFLALGARVIADDGSDAVTVAATSADFSRPDDAIFAFAPPPGAEVTEVSVPAGPPTRPAHTGDKPKVHGTGWTAVAVADVGKQEPDQAMTTLLESLPEVSGTWGHGRLLATALVTAVITDDGRVAVGAVTPERVYAALAEK